jgi:hypothetical protein
MRVGFEPLSQFSEGLEAVSVAQKSGSPRMDSVGHVEVPVAVLKLGEGPPAVSADTGGHKGRNTSGATARQSLVRVFDPIGMKVGVEHQAT